MEDTCIHFNPPKSLTIAKQDPCEKQIAHALDVNLAH